MNKLVLIVVILGYLGVLFGIATLAERYARKGKRILPQSLIYALSIAVFCTAWTFFGSIGSAARGGLGFLPVYLGPTIFMPLIAFVLIKLIRICQSQRITSIADFISSRYGKNISLGVIVALFCIVGIVPYIAIQLKAISATVNLLTQYSDTQHVLWTDTTFYTAIGLAIFISIYGIRNVDTTERHSGVITAIAFESIVKLIVFLCIGVYVCYFLFPDICSIFRESLAIEAFKNHFVVQEKMSVFSWFLISLVSALAIILLPRQFQVAVVENTNEQHVRKAMWLFPLYLFLINLFVLPIALAGVMSFPKGIDLDMLLLHFPIQHQHPGLALLVFIGGFSAATGMVIVELIALTIMISNHISIPILIHRSKFQTGKIDLTKFILLSRRVGVFILILLAYLFEKSVAEQNSLVSIGLISFAAVAQFAPAVIFGLFWKKANRKAAVTSIVLGFAVWFFTLVIPSLSSSFPALKEICDQGLFHLSILKPTALFGLSSLDSIGHGIFWSLLLNTFSFLIISFHTDAGAEETHQAILFVDGNSQRFNEVKFWKGSTSFIDIQQLLNNFLGTERTKVLLEGYANRHSILMQDQQEADYRIVSFAERILGGVIGSASSRLMISSVTKDEKVSIQEVLSIVKESQQIIELNKELRKKSQELSKASNELSHVNEQLKRMDELKNEFLYTVTHELRTPLTSIRALSEIVHDNPEMDEIQKQEYLNVIIRETEKLSHLITQVLNLEKYESGRQKIYPVSFDLKNLVLEIIQSLKPLSDERSVNMKLICPDSTILLHADKDLIAQLIYNFLSNAIKFAQQQIELFIQPTLDDIEVIVSDDGPGVDELNKELLFDKFYQSKQHQLQKPEGSGLGLAICKRIVELHHGKIWVENNEGKGARFIFVIPIIH